MRTFALVLAIATASGCCCGRKAENLVSDAPATLVEAKALAKPPDVTVEVERVTRRAGGGGACHSAVCLIILPVLLFEAVFPEKYDVVTVKTKGVETFSGTFTSKGALINGVVHLEGGDQKEVLGVDLDALGKTMVVESARTKGGVRTLTTLQSQHDFLADYDKALAKETDDDRRGRLLTEALQWLDVEALPMVVKRLEDPAEPDRSKADVVHAVCSVKTPHAPAVIAALTEPLGPFTASAAWPCAADDARKTALAAAIVTGTCAQTDTNRVYELNKKVMDLLQDHALLKPAISTAAKACPPHLAALFALQLREDVDPKGLEQLLRSAHVNAAAPYLTFTKPAHREGFFAALASGEQTPELLRVTFPEKLSPEELAQLAQAYAIDRSFLGRNSIRGNVLGALKRHANGVDTTLARKRIAAGGKGPWVDVALVVLGDTSRAEAASKGTESPLKPEDRSIVSEGDLVNFGFLQSGCTEAELKGWLMKTSVGRGPLSCSGWVRK